MFNVILYNKIEWSTDSGLFLYEKQDRDDKRQPGTPSGVWFKPAPHPTSVIFMYSERVRVDNSHLSTNPPTDSAALCSRKTKTFSGWCHCALCAVTRWPSLLCRQDKEWPLDLGELSHGSFVNHDPSVSRLRLLLCLGPKPNYFRGPVRTKVFWCLFCELQCF